MTLFRTVAPAAEPVTLAEAKAQLRLSHGGEDAFIESLIRAARETVEAETGLAMLDQDWRLVLDQWPSGELKLRRHPVRQFLSITVYGVDGEGSLLDPDAYRTDTMSRPARVRLVAPPPQVRCMNGFEIDFRAGFGESGADVPDGPKRAILLLVAHWYEFRAEFGADDQPVSMPSGYERLIAPWRMRRLG